MTALSLPLPTLYSASTDIVDALDTLESLDEEDESLRPEIEEHIARLIASDPERVDAVARLLAHLESQAELASKEIARLTVRREYFLRTIERIEACAAFAIELSRSASLRGRTSTLYLAPDRSVFVEDFRRLPDTYKLVSTSPNKEAILEAALSGTHVPGTRVIETQHLERL